MIIGIGCDIVAHSLTDDLNWESDKQTLQRILSEREIDLHKSQRTTQFLSGRFAAKEAVLKCIGTGMQDGLSLNDIQILSDSLGKPTINLKGRIKEICDQLGVKVWHVSISHSPDYSVAFVIAEH